MVLRCLCGTRLVGKFVALGMCSNCDKSRIQVEDSTIYKELLYRYNATNLDLTQLANINKDLEHEITTLRNDIIKLQTDNSMLANENQDLQNDYNYMLRDRLKFTSGDYKFDSINDVKLLKLTKDDTNCSICFDNISKDEYVKHLECNHKYHKNCLYKYFLKVGDKCPLCRVPLTRNSTIIDDSCSDVGSVIDAVDSIIITDNIPVIRSRRVRRRRKRNHQRR
jgi:hypothetical protein